MDKKQFIEKCDKEIQQKIQEVERSDFEKESIVPFGYRYIDEDNYIHTVTDWGNIKKEFISKLSESWDQAMKENSNNVISKLNMILLGIQVFKKSESERVEEEKRGLRRRDGGPFICAFSLIDRISAEIKKIAEELTNIDIK